MSFTWDHDGDVAGSARMEETWTCRSCGKVYTEEGEGYDYCEFPYNYSARNGYCKFCWLVYPLPDGHPRRDGYPLPDEEPPHP